MPGRAWHPLIAVVVALGIPVAAAAEWHHLVARHPIAALALASGWVAAYGIAVAVRKALAGPTERRLEQAGNAADRAAGWWLSGYGRMYRRWVLDSRRYIDVKDLATGGDHTPQLDDVYVDVALVRRAPHQVSSNPLGDVPEDATVRHPVSDFLDHADPAVLAILGPPGCGKTTLLAHIARRTSQVGRRHRIPVLLALREHAAAIAANSQRTLPEAIRAAVSSMPDKEPAGWWDRQLQRHRCLILLDGLDEVARDEDRRAITKWVERQISIYQGNDFLITSRPHGFLSPVIPQADILGVCPFTSEQVSLFLKRWYLATEKHATGAATEAQMRSVRIIAGESADRLIALLRANPALHDLTVNPLLLTMIAMVHRYRAALPGSRAALYGEICQVMLSRRIQAKDLPEVLPGQAKHKLMAALACQMMLDQVTELSAEQALKILDPLMRRLRATVTGQTFLDDVSHNGLLIEPASGRYAFAHLTFQEYLAARHISDHPSLAQALIEGVDDQWWRESILLYTAMADADQIVRACLNKGTIRALALAFDCAETSGELAPDLRKRLGEARDRAFTEDCDPQYRQLIAAVLAVQLSREIVTTPAGSRVCDHPVPADLYWLFLKDTQATKPDQPCEPNPDRPATGMWGDEATTFVRWLNEVTADSQVGFRLPGPTELETGQVTDEAIWRLPESVTGLWTRRRYAASHELWIPSGRAHPHHITADAIEEALEADISKTGILDLILSVTRLDATLTIYQLLTFAYKAKLAGDDAAFAHDLDRARELALDRDLVLDLNRARALARHRDLNRALDRALDRDLRLAHAHASFLERNLHVNLDLNRALELAYGPKRNRNRVLDRDLDLFAILATRHGSQARPAIQLLGIPDVPLIWISRGPLGNASEAADAMNPSANQSKRIFAERLTLLAGVSANSAIEASLDDSLLESLHRISQATSQRYPADTEWSLEEGAQRLANAAAPLLSSRQPTDSHAASVRVIALALAASCAEQDDDAINVLQTLAATVTLLQRRAKGTSPIGEGIVLALA